MTGALGRLAGRALSAVLDPTVVLSFDRTGFRRHALGFDPRDLAVDLTGRVAVVTGANSGIGRATARALALRGATVRLLCRRDHAGREAAAALRAEVPGAGPERVAAVPCDVGDLASVDAACDALLGDPAVPAVHALVHNAGLLPDARRRTAQGHELTLAVHVVGPQRLTARLLPRLRRDGDARVVWVSSGGMYTQRLDVEAVLDRPPSTPGEGARPDGPGGRRPPYDGVVAYARTKRAQVALAALWAEALLGSSVTVHAMHPGWADTPAVETSLPRFHALTRRLLRSPEEGADTVVWLACAARAAASSGGFWFDRRQVRPHVLPGARDDPAERARLWAEACRLAGVDPRSLEPGPWPREA